MHDARAGLRTAPKNASGWYGVFGQVERDRVAAPDAERRASRRQLASTRSPSSAYADPPVAILDRGALADTGFDGAVEQRLRGAVVSIGASQRTSAG